MINTIFCINLLSLILGGVAIFIVFSLYRNYHYKYLLAFTWNICTFNIISILYIPETAIYRSLQSDSLSVHSLVFMAVYFTTINVMKYIWSYTFVLFTRNLLSKRISGRFRTILLSIASVSLVFFVIAFLRGRMLGEFLAVRRIDSLITFQTTSLNYISAFILLIQIRKLGNAKMLKACHLFFIPFLLIATGLYIVDLLGVFIDTRMVKILFIGCILLTGNLLPIVVLPYFVKLFGSADIQQSKGVKEMEILFRKFAISKREREIVHLICQGRSNQQIADELFISLYTVKDHIHNIFRKTGAKNRIQLTNLFR